MKEEIIIVEIAGESIEADSNTVFYVHLDNSEEFWMGSLAKKNLHEMIKIFNEFYKRRAEEGYEEFMLNFERMQTNGLSLQSYVQNREIFDGLNMILELLKIYNLIVKNQDNV